MISELVTAVTKLVTMVTKLVTIVSKLVTMVSKLVTTTQNENLFSHTPYRYVNNIQKCS